MKLYTLIVYRPNGSYGYDRYDREYSDSEIRIEFFENREDLIKSIFIYKKKSTEQDREYQDWEFNVLIDGRSVNCWDDLQTDDNPEFYEILGQAQDLYAEWQKQESDRKEDEKRKEELEKVKIKAANDKKQIQQEKALLKTLLEKYPSVT